MYRRHLVKSITARGDLSLQEFLKRLTIKEAIYMFALGEAIVTSDDTDDSDE
ncbi:hypothetical protein DPMN_092594 [Dreissena polymorpha]|uniref:Uncharacterized protein n=1 Tax=Dreissena polymorpha TaxID=45954 RepID=A0A9D4L2K9_DREPO|nr:hypothetical protein DPMN_092594 [Dreissena polymorpha]